MTIDVINPATGKKEQSFEKLKDNDINRSIDLCREAWEEWQYSDMNTRAEKMRKAAGVLKENKDEYASLMAREMGKPVSAGVSEVEKCAWVCEYYAENAENFLASENVETDASQSFITYQPLGPVLAVMPWNFPFWQVFRFAAPALMAGNAGLLKHASNVPGCSQAIEDVFLKAGFPKHLFKSLLIDSDKVEQVIRNSSVMAVTLTGSTPAGKSVASIAGDELKKSVLELGGSDPYVVLHDADLKKAAETCASSRMINSGQSCIAAKRFIIVKEVYDVFLEHFVKEMDKYTPGDPLNKETTCGPMARVDLRDELHQQVLRSVEKGAKCVLGGSIPDGDGAWYPPTVLTQVEPGMPAYDEELFGPVASVILVENEEEAIRVANDTSFGLGAAVFTKDLERGRHIAATKIRAGSCFVNSFVKSDPRLPFGGIKSSGYGRELSVFGIREFVNIKTVYVE
jgi:succinate-semialdehyde dehydrogenase/glutarate-semialdehyde dehydrogenase